MVNKPLIRLAISGGGYVAGGGGWLTSHDSIFTPNLGGMIQFDGRAYFSNGLVKNHHLGDGVGNFVYNETLNTLFYPNYSDLTRPHPKR